MSDSAALDVSKSLEVSFPSVSLDKRELSSMDPEDRERLSWAQLYSESPVPQIELLGRRKFAVGLADDTSLGRRLLPDSRL
jgi:hypothetical protein